MGLIATGHRNGLCDFRWKLLGIGQLSSAARWSLMLVAETSDFAMKGLRQARGVAGSGKAAGLIFRCIVILFAVFSLSSCGGERHVNPAAVAEVRSVGNVLAEVTSEWYWGDEGQRVTSFNKTLIVDMNSTSSAGALKEARALLIERGWRDETSVYDDGLYMTSGKWENLELYVSAMADYIRTWRLEDSGEPEVADAIRRSLKLSASESLLMMRLYP